MSFIPHIKIVLKRSFCKSHSCFIVNGRIGDDTCGDFTFVGRQGCSDIDIFYCFNVNVRLNL